MDLKKRFPRDVNIDTSLPKDFYPVLDNDLARDNIENDLPEADLQDL